MLVAFVLLNPCSALSFKKKKSYKASIYPIFTQFAQMHDGFYLKLATGANFKNEELKRGDVSPLAPNVEKEVQVGNLRVVKGEIIRQDHLEIEKLSLNMPAIDLRYTFLDRYRLGFNTSFNYSRFDMPNFITRDLSQNFIVEAGSKDYLGIPAVNLTSEIKIVDNLNFFFNQTIPFSNNPALGRNLYAFQLGLEAQKKFNLGFERHLDWYSNLGWGLAFAGGRRLYDLNKQLIIDPGNIGSIFYNNAFVLPMRPISPLFEVLVNQRFFNYSIDDFSRTYPYEFRQTTALFVPGFVVPIGDDNENQFHFGVPFGVTDRGWSWGFIVGYFRQF